MRRIRVIPVLLLYKGGLYKTIKFKQHNYIGDPINAIKIFNDKDVDELVVLDIEATQQNRDPNYDSIKEFASECFMPLAYGGGIKTVEQAQKIFNLGAEKIIINSAFNTNPDLIKQLSEMYGSQSVVVSVDVKKNLFGSQKVYTQSATKNTNQNAVEYCKKAVEYGAGEIFLNSIDLDGTRKGYDLQLIKSVASAVSVPLVACGGASNLSDFLSAVKDSDASAVAAGSMFVYKGGINSVLINYPTQKELETSLFLPLTK